MSTTRPASETSASIIRSDEDVETALRLQALQYARAPAESRIGNETEVLLFLLGGEQYAVELHLLQSVHPPTGITKIPCSPPSIAGIVNVRGEVVTILNLIAAFGIDSTAAQSKDSRIVLVDAPAGGRVGLLVDSVVGVRRIGLADLDRSWFRQEYTDGIAEAAIILVNLERLLTSEGFDLCDGAVARIEGRPLDRSRA